MGRGPFTIIALAIAASCGSRTQLDGAPEAGPVADVGADVDARDASEEDAPPPTGPCVLAITAGSVDSCAIKADHSLWCWGLHTGGATPVEISALGPVAQVSAGYAHVCARKVDGTVWCWGKNNEGQLGDGTTNDENAPVAVSALGDQVVDVSAGDFHTCAVKSDGTVWCWGANGEGQLGEGAPTVFETAPVKVQTITDATQVSAASHHTCVRASSGAWCFGYDGDGELGNGTSGWDANTPVPVSVLGSDIAEVSTGMSFSCARTNEGQVWCWGNASFAADVDASTQTVPVLATKLPGTITRLASRGAHMCAIASDGTVWCWGGERDGELGDGQLENWAIVPEHLTLVSGPIDAIAAGHMHTCVLRAGSVSCWGYNGDGQLGTSATGESCHSEDPYWQPQSTNGTCVLAAVSPAGLCP